MSKFLIAGDSRKAIRKGKYVEADASAQEFIYDGDTIADNAEITVAVLKAVGEANGLTVKSAWNRGELIANITPHLETLDLPEQNKMTIDAIIKETVSQCAQTRDPSEDSDSFEIEVLTTVITTLRAQDIKFKIKSLGGLVKKEIISQGLILTAKDRKEQGQAKLAEMGFAPQEWSDVEAACEVLVKELTDTTNTQAMGIIRAFCKAGEIEMPKRTKPKKLPFRGRMIDFLVQNSPASEEQVLEFLKTEEKEKSLGTAMKLKEVIDQAFAAGASSVGGEAQAA